MVANEVLVKSYMQYSYYLSAIYLLYDKAINDVPT